MRYSIYMEHSNGSWLGFNVNNRKKAIEIAEFHHKIGGSIEISIWDSKHGYYIKPWCP